MGVAAMRNGVDCRRSRVPVRAMTRPIVAFPSAATPPPPDAGSRSDARVQRDAIAIPPEANSAELQIGDRRVRLTNLDKVFWPRLGLTKRDLLQYYADVAFALLPHLAGRAMVMKRYPNGAEGESFFMKRAPVPRPDWIDTCSIEHGSGSVIDFPIVQDLASLLWLVNHGCIDLNPWYARCDDVDRPDYLHFDLDPVPDAGFERVRETARVLRIALQGLGMTPLVKTTGSRGLHLYVAIVRGPTQKQVWTFAKRPPDRVLVDYNQNAWGRTLASVYSPRPRPKATVSTPITWDELDAGATIEDFRIDNVPARLRDIGELWAPLLAARGRFDLAPLL